MNNCCLHPQVMKRIVTDLLKALLGGSPVGMF
jgi:hypothetical protein